MRKVGAKRQAASKLQCHPMQPVEWDGEGVIRFKTNSIVRYLLDNGSLDLNDLAKVTFSDDDWTQLAQLIGYSVLGAGDLSYFDQSLLARADRKAAKL